MKRKLKEPVRLRAKILANGNQSLYLDSYYNGKRSYEFLKLYLIPENSKEDKLINEATIAAANAIKAKRILAIVNGKADIKTVDVDLTVSEWIDRIIERKSGIKSHSSIALMQRLQSHLSRYTFNIYRGKMCLREVDRQFCTGFANYLKTATALNSQKQLCVATQYELLNALSIVLNEAVREEYLPNNPMRLLTSAERIKKPESTRDYLSREEIEKLLKQLSEDNSDNDIMKAFLFCCFSGLRYSDIARLKWDNIVEKKGSKEISIIVKKTGRPLTVPISSQAEALLPQRGVSDDRVFRLPKYHIVIRQLKKAAASVGIRKKVTFHVSRHTFATLLLTAGCDLYTISKLIGHSDIRTTQIYSKVLDEKKREAVGLLDRLF